MQRQVILDRAASKIGNPDPDIFWAEVLPGYRQGGQKGLSWCGAFALWSLRPVTSRMWKLGYGFLNVPPALPHIEVPLMGDVAYFDRPFQHHAIVERIDGENLISIDGNQGPPETVRRKVRKLVPVDYVQRALNTHGAKLKDDGIAGPMTRNAIMSFQNLNNLQPDGMANMLTLKALGLRPTAVFFSIAEWVR